MSVSAKSSPTKSRESSSASAAIYAKQSPKLSERFGAPLQGDHRQGPVDSNTAIGNTNGIVVFPAATTAGSAGTSPSAIRRSSNPTAFLPQQASELSSVRP